MRLGHNRSTLFLFAVLALPVAGCGQAEEKPGNQQGSGTGGTTGGGVGIPAAPTEVLATLAEPRVVVVTWKDNSDNENGFSVQRQAGSGDFREIARTAVNVTQFRDTTVSSMREYIYRVASMDDMGRAVLAAEDSLIDVP